NLFQTINWYRYNEATGVPSLSATTISNISFNCPPLEEQKEISKIIWTMEEQIEHHKKDYSQLKGIQKAFLRQLF
ncbi:restriction endonuclease subunit S, partial [Priestia megaterium]|uniref:restriction endonuclease subunit S n=1 Tax=Priestia megaterium TaxID=1404 RepID=UPI0030002A5D